MQDCKVIMWKPMTCVCTCAHSWEYEAEQYMIVMSVFLVCLQA